MKTIWFEFNVNLDHVKKNKPNRKAAKSLFKLKPEDNNQVNSIRPKCFEKDLCLFKR